MKGAPPAKIVVLPIARPVELPAVTKVPTASAPVVVGDEPESVGLAPVPGRPGMLLFPALKGFDVGLLAEDMPVPSRPENAVLFPAWNGCEDVDGC